MSTVHCLAAGALALVTAAGPAATVRFEVTGFDNTKGRARCGLFVEKGWGEEGKNVSGVDAEIVDGKAVCTFPEVKPGRYGAIVYHDKNGNEKMDRNFLGIPSESYCFSQNAQGGMGVPKFAAASFAVSESGDTVTKCKL
ncbi:MAG: DUF2141 domain-containing protein [Myxococcota bacterium]